MESNQTIIKASNISKTFWISEGKNSTFRSWFISIFNQHKSKRFKALDSINLEVKKGEFVGIIGKNGSGKSTLLKIIAGIYSPDKGGELKISGKIIPFLELGVGFNPELTGRENIFLNGTILGMSIKFLKQKYKTIVEFAELEEFIDTPVKNYSSGMKIRLAFSIAAQANGDIYILDEILSVGDAYFRQKSLDVIYDFVKRGRTILYVTHNLNAIKLHCNRAIWINRGKIIFDGSPDKATERYKVAIDNLNKVNEKI